MNERDLLARRFEESRAHLRAVAYRMLGSVAEADDAVQEAWLRLERADAGAIDNLGGWLTTVVGRVCLDMLRTRTSRREQPVPEDLPDELPDGGADPEQQALLTDSVGLALLVVLDTLEPAERLAFVLHDMFAMPFEQIAPIVDRTPAATRQLASRARRRARDGRPPDPDRARQRAVVQAFLAAARGGDLAALVAVLDPDVVVRTHAAGGLEVVRGAATVARRAAMFARLAPGEELVLAGGRPAVVAAIDGEVRVMVFTVAAGRITEMNVVIDPVRLRELDLSLD